jgi:pimeloyl-ACP methyl ester carboxylesterase
MPTLKADPSLYPVPLAATTRRIDVSTAEGPLAALETLPPAGVAVRGTAVLTPGFSGSKEDFIPLLGLLAEGGYRVVTYDQRGQFESAGPAKWSDYTVAGFAQDLAEVIKFAQRNEENKENEEPVHLLGHSFGGVVVQHFTVDHPATLASLTLLDSGPGGTEFSGAKLAGPMVWILRVGGSRGLWAVMKGQLKKAGVAVGSQVWLEHRLRNTSPANLIGIVRALLKEPARTAEVAATKVPTLVMYGENDQPWTPDTQARMAEKLGARHVVIANAAHTPNEEQPEETAKELLAFWDSVSGG